MSDSDSLIPVFLPSLAQMLAFVEQKSEGLLTQEQVEAVRDNAPCIMMKPEDAKKMAERRNFEDVNPKNCWSDWHRLRPQLVRNAYLPRIVLCLCGDDDLPKRTQPILEAQGIEHELRTHDPKLVRAFQISSMTRPSFTDDDYARISRHTKVLFVLSKRLPAADALVAARNMLRLGRQLLELGAVAIKCDSSGAGHSREQWTGFDTASDVDDDHRWPALFKAYVVNHIGSEIELYSCGMHLLGFPDLIISREAATDSTPAGGNTVAGTAELFRAFALYLIAECPIGAFGSGHTFSLSQASPRYRVFWEPCTGFAEDVFFFNPFGRWRFTLLQSS